jgi:hypothetical protein
MSINLKAITVCIGYQQITDLTSAVGLTVPAMDKTGLRQMPTIALITPLTGAVRWRDDGTNPSSTVGMPLAAGVTLQYDGNLNGIKFINNGGTAELNISYYA